MDRLTQLQECSLKLYEIFYTAIGALQRDAPLMELNAEVPVTCWTQEQIKKNWEGNVELSKSAAKDIVETVKVIDILIDSLPGIADTEEEQVQK
jgi:asparagine synthetase A